MNTTISTAAKTRSYDVLELAPRASTAHVGQVAAVSRSAGSVHITMTEAAARDLADSLDGDQASTDANMWSQICADLRAARDLDAAQIPPSKWQASVVAGFDGSQSGDIAFATVLRVPHWPKHRADHRFERVFLGHDYVPRHAKTADEIEASR